jgi:hypothetical protein
MKGPAGSDNGQYVAHGLARRNAVRTWCERRALSHITETQSTQCPDRTNRAMALLTSLGPSADCMGLAQVVKYQGQTHNTRAAIFLVSPRSFSLG